MSNKRLIIITLILLLLFYIPAFSKNQVSEREKARIKNNKISVITEYLFKAPNPKKKKMVQNFDVNGNKISTIEFDNNERQVRKIEYSYDLKGNLESFVEYDSKGNIRLKCRNKYDKNDVLNDELFYDRNNVFVYRRISKADSAGNISEQILWDKNNKRLGKSIYKYDSQGNKIDSIFYDSRGAVNSRTICKYDNKSNLIEALSYDKNNKFVEKKAYFYNESDIIKEIKNYNNIGAVDSFSKCEYEFHRQIVAKTKPDAVKEEKKEPVDLTSEVKIAQNVHTVTNHNEPIAKKKEPENHPAHSIDKPEENKPSIEKNNKIADYNNPDVNTTMTPSEIINFAVVARPETIKGLAEHNSTDLNAQNDCGQTALMMAVVGNNEKVVEFLIDRGVDLKIKDINGISVIYYLKACKNQKIINLIKEHYKE